jgi:Rieske Fe-S protein
MASRPYEREEEDVGERLDRHWNELLQELRARPAPTACRTAGAHTTWDCSCHGSRCQSPVGGRIRRFSPDGPATRPLDTD